MVCFHYYSFTFFLWAGGLCFYGQNSWFSDIIFEHHNNFLSNIGRRWACSTGTIFAMFFFAFLLIVKSFVFWCSKKVFKRSDISSRLLLHVLLESFLLFWWFSCLLVSAPARDIVSHHPTIAQREFSSFYSFNNVSVLLRQQYFESHDERNVTLNPRKLSSLNIFHFQPSATKAAPRDRYTLYFEHNKQPKQKNVRNDKENFSCKLMMSWRNRQEKR